MGTELDSQLLELIREGKSILAEYPTKRQVREGIEHFRKIKKPAPLEAIVKNAGNEIVGDFYQDLAKEGLKILGLPKKYARGLRNIPRRQEKYQLAQENERMKQWMESEYQRSLNTANNRFMEWDKKLKGFLSKVSVIDDGKVIVTSKQLLQRVHSKDKYSKPDTRIKHIIAILEECSHYTVVFTEEMKDYSIGQISEKIRTLEEALRIFISTELGKVYMDDWWIKGIPPDIRKSAEEKREKAIKSGAESTNTALIQFIEFSDIGKILERRDNRKYFGVKLKPIDAFIIKLKELEPIRNKLFHSRELSKKDLEKVNLYVQEFLDKARSQ